VVNLQDYIADSSLFKTFKVDDLLFVEYRCLVEEDESSVWSHNNYFAYVVGGEKKWKSPASEYKVGRGEALFVRRGAHTVYQYFDEPFIVLFVFLPDEFIRNVLARHPGWDRVDENSGDECNHLIPLKLNKVLESVFHSFLAHFSSHAVQSKEILRLKLEELVLNVLVQPENVMLKQYFYNLARHKQINIEEVMTANYLMPLTIHDYARLCGRSLASFRRDFEHQFHSSPGKWLLTKRLEYARYLLETTDKQINEIIDSTGFKNRSHFSKAFKERYGRSPKHFQQQILTPVG
jgi:AraC-like DNA-binding protein